jgi:periplasmic divalent cation tolerance protein
MTGLCLVSTTVADASQAKSLSELILMERLGACVQCSQVLSRYHWEGKLCEEVEQLLQVKTTTQACDKLCDLIAANHPYKVPEIIVTPIVSAAADYSKWVKDSIFSG